MMSILTLQQMPWFITANIISSVKLRTVSTVCEPFVSISRIPIIETSRNYANMEAVLSTRTETKRLAGDNAVFMNNVGDNSSVI